MQKELAYRDNDGIAVTLFWHSRSNALSVCVYDSRNGDWFELDAEPQNAMDVFEHPYAYAARRGTASLAFAEPLAA
jgi:hypothetical protein